MFTSPSRLKNKQTSRVFTTGSSNQAPKFTHCIGSHTPSLCSSLTVLSSAFLSFYENNAAHWRTSPLLSNLVASGPGQLFPPGGLPHPAASFPCMIGLFLFGLGFRETTWLVRERSLEASTVTKCRRKHSIWKSPAAGLVRRKRVGNVVEQGPGQHLGLPAPGPARPSDH